MSSVRPYPEHKACSFFRRKNMKGQSLVPSGRKGGILFGILITWGAILLGTGCAPTRHELGTRFFPEPPDPPKIQFLERISSSSDIEQRSAFQTMVTGNLLPRRFAKPYGLAVHDGKIYVCDAQLHTVFVIDPAKHSFTNFKTFGNGKLIRPLNIAIDQDGTKYVADYKRREIMVYDSRDKFIRSFGGKKDFKPTGVAVFQDRLYVADVQNNEVDVMDKHTGEFLDTIGEPGQDEGQFYRPTNVTVDPKGNIYVTDVINSRVEKFDPEGNYLMTFGKLGDRIGDFARPKGIAVDHKGFLYAVDSAFENVQIFDPEGKPALFFGGFGGPDVPGALWLPAGITITYDPALLSYFAPRIHPDFNARYLVLVISQYGPSYMNIYAFGDAREGSPLAKGEGDPNAYHANQKAEKKGTQGEKTTKPSTEKKPDQ